MSILRVKRLIVTIMLSISTTEATLVGQLGEQTSLFSLLRNLIWTLCVYGITPQRM